MRKWLIGLLLILGLCAGFAQAETYVVAVDGTGDFQTLIKGKYLQESLQYIPYSDGKKFTLSATTIVSKSGKQIPLMECGASYEDFLNGLDENAVQELIDNAMISGAYPGLKIGDITTDNNNAGNW